MMDALDLLGRRWSLRIVWELRAGPLGARALLTSIGGLSSSVLYDRLRDLTTAGLITRTKDDSYTLTRLGTSLGSAMVPMDAWAKGWSRTLAGRPAVRR